jgi:glutamate/tyrosine decarboxylase-like PLP-dependent enzyme
MHDYSEDLTAAVLALVVSRLRAGPGALGSPGTPAELDKALTGLIAAAGRPAAEVLRVYTGLLEPTVIARDDPRFLAFFQGAPSQAAMLFDMVLSATSMRGVTWLGSSGPVAAENQVLRLLAERAGMPAGAGGCFVSGGCAANLSALVVARDMWRRAAGPAVAGPCLMALSDQAHPSVFRALDIIGAAPLLIRTGGHRLTGAALTGALRGHTGEVACVFATAGTPNSGAIDDLDSLARIAREHHLWFHVDAAYGGGAALFVPQMRERFTGIEHADSLVVDPHKWLFSPYDSSALLYRQPELARSVHVQRAPYFDVIHEDGPTDWNPSDYAYHSTRRPRGLPLWFSLAVHGTDAYGRAVAATLRLARQLAEIVRELPHLDLVTEPALSVVLVRRLGWQPADYRAWSQLLLAEQTGFVAPTTWNGETVARFAFLHPKTTLEMVKEIIASMA